MRLLEALLKYPEMFSCPFVLKKLMHKRWLKVLCQLMSFSIEEACQTFHIFSDIKELSNNRSDGLICMGPFKNTTVCHSPLGHKSWTRLSDYTTATVCQKWKSLSCVRLFAIPWNSPGQNTGVGSLSLLQGILPTQESNPGLPHCRQILCQLSESKHQFQFLEWLVFLGS